MLVKYKIEIFNKYQNTIHNVNLNVMNNDGY